MLVVRDCILSAPAVLVSPKIDLDKYFKHVAEGVLLFDLKRNSVLAGDRGAAEALIQAAARRDTSPAPIVGQLDAAATGKALAAVVAKVRALPDARPAKPLESNGHTRKTDPADYIDLNPKTTRWEIDDVMDSRVERNSEYIAMAQAGDDVVVMRRAPNSPQGAWPHVIIRNLQVDLDRTPFLTWKQKDPGPDPLPEGYKTRDEKNRLDKGVSMPMGYAVRVLDHATGKLALLRETHTPPWFKYQAHDLRKIFGLGHAGGKRIITIKYYALGVYITGMPGSGMAIPPEYHILDFLRLEKE